MAERTPSPSAAELLAERQVVALERIADRLAELRDVLGETVAYAPADQSSAYSGAVRVVAVTRSVDGWRP